MRIILRPLSNRWTRERGLSTQTPGSTPAHPIFTPPPFLTPETTHTWNAVVSHRARRSQPNHPLPLPPPLALVSPPPRATNSSSSSSLPISPVSLSLSLSDARVRPSVRPATATPVHSPSFLMLGSYSRCAERASGPFHSLGLARASYEASPSFSLSLSLPPSRSYPFRQRDSSISRPGPRVSVRWPRTRCNGVLVVGGRGPVEGAAKKKRRGLRSIFITQTGRPSGTHKKCLFTYGDWSATGLRG